MYLQRFQIDDHLERFESALENLALAGTEKFEEVVAYTVKHGKFVTALKIYKNDPVSHKVSLFSNILNEGRN